MNTGNNQSSGNQDKNQQTSGTEQNENVNIIMPKNARPEGPFEHSGESAGWTKEEEEEMTQQQDNNPQNQP